jgi:hypothetical protein
LYWFHRHSTGAHTGKSHNNTHNNANASDHSDRDSQSYACDIHQHDEPYTYQYIDTDTYSNSDAHIYIVPARYIDSLSNVDTVVNAFSNSVHDAQFHIDTLVHCRRSITHTFHNLLPICDINISLI